MNSFVLVNGRGQVIDRIDRATSYDSLSRMLQHYKVRATPATIRGQTPIAIPDLKSPRAASPLDSLSPTTRIASSLEQLSNRSAQPGTQSFVPAGANSNATVDVANSIATGSTGDPTESAMASTIRLRVEDAEGHSFGTGTVIDVHGQEALVLTCGHIFRESDGKGRILMDRFDSPTAEPTVGSLISYDMDLDIGLVSMKLTRPIVIAKLAPLSYKAAPNDPTFSVGCSRGERPTVMQGKVNRIDKYLGPPNITASGRPVDGRSGGGLFNAAGHLIGVCSAADPELDEGLYAALPRVYYELDRNGLTFVYDEDSGASPIAEVATTSRDLRGLATRAGDAANGAQVPEPSEFTNHSPNSLGQELSSTPGRLTAANVRQGQQGQQELVCVLKGDGKDDSKVFVIKNPSQTLIDYLTREAAKSE